MLNSSKYFPARISCYLLACLALSGYSYDAASWGTEGHTAVGILAVGQLQPEALLALEGIVSPLNKQAMAAACNWPDDLRETDAGNSSSPLHYVNIPRGNEVYSVTRDCPEPAHSETADLPARFCITEAIKYFAAGIADAQASREQRWQAFAWLCHLVGDLHQPLHAGFADDRGGNDVEVVFNGEAMDLHEFWDTALIQQKAGSWQYLVGELGVFPPAPAGLDWSPDSVDDWTNESHNLDRFTVYPATANIEAAYALQSWELIQKQIRLAATRLATIINHQLKPAEPANPPELPGNSGQ
jgi:hypothetical protein